MLNLNLEALTILADLLKNETDEVRRQNDEEIQAIKDADHLTDKEVKKAAKQCLKRYQDIDDQLKRIATIANNNRIHGFASLSKNGRRYFTK